MTTTKKTTSSTFKTLDYHVDGIIYSDQAREIRIGVKKEEELAARKTKEARMNAPLSIEETVLLNLKPVK